MATLAFSTATKRLLLLRGSLRAKGPLQVFGEPSGLPSGQQTYHGLTIKAEAPVQRSVQVSQKGLEKCKVLLLEAQGMPGGPYLQHLQEACIRDSVIRGIAQA